MRAHGGAEPLVGLEIDLMLCAIQRDGPIPWEKTQENGFK